MALRKRTQDETIILFSNIDVLRIRDLIDGGRFVIGGPGAGRSIRTTTALTRTFQRAVTGDAGLTPKGGGANIFAAHPEACGRGHDVIQLDAATLTADEERTNGAS